MATLRQVFFTEKFLVHTKLSDHKAESILKKASHPASSVFN